MGRGVEIGRALERDVVAAGVGLCAHRLAGLGGATAHMGLDAADVVPGFGSREAEHGHLRGGAGQPRTERTEEDRRRTERIGPGNEGRRHQRMAVELTAEIEPLAGVPGGEDRPQRPDQLLQL